MIERLIAIDPGMKTGVALFEFDYDGNQKIINSGLLYVKDSLPDEDEFSFYRRADALCLCVDAYLNEYDPTVIAIEEPFFSRSRIEVAETGSLLKLISLFGRYWEMSTLYAPTIAFVKVIEWKGQTPKEIQETRTKKRMKELWMDYGKEEKTSHEWDAIGIGLYTLERMRKQALEW